MNKKKFHSLISDQKKVAKTDLQNLDELQLSHPYSQVIHALVARSHIASKTGDAQQKLTHAAIYSTDRKTLKAFIEGQGTATKQQSPAQSKPAPKRAVSTAKKSNLKDTKRPTSAPEKKPSAKPEAPKAVEKQVEKKSPAMRPTEKAVQQKAPVPADKTAADPKPQATGHDEMEAIRNEIMMSLKSLSESKKAFEEPQKPVRSKPGRKKKVTEKKSPKISSVDGEIIQNINQLKAKPVGPKQKKQNKLIEKFIEKKPSIKTPQQTTEAEQSDLSSQSVKFGDNLISENLAKILVSQGKVDKAKEIYKKLIWKYPQKKTYFAAQIKGLEKK